MKILDLIWFLIKTLLKNGNLSIRFFGEGMNFPLEEKDFKVDEWNGKVELHIE